MQSGESRGKALLLLSDRCSAGLFSRNRSVPSSTLQSQKRRHNRHRTQSEGQTRDEPVREDCPTHYSFFSGLTSSNSTVFFTSCNADSGQRTITELVRISTPMEIVLTRKRSRITLAASAACTCRSGNRYIFSAASS